MGLGTAYLDGFKYSTGDFIIIMDADLSHHPKYIPQMIKKQIVRQSDIVIGSRYIDNGGICGWSFFRKLTSRVANFVTNQMLGADVSDFTNSFRLYKKSVFEKLSKLVTNKGFGFQMEIMTRAVWDGRRVDQVPIVFVDRIYGASKFGSNEVYMFLNGLWELFSSER